MIHKHVPRKLWDYGSKWSSEIMQRTHVRATRLNGGVPLENVSGETVNISEYLDFSFYDWVWYWDQTGTAGRKLGPWLGVSHRTGSQLCYYVLTGSCSVISRGTVSRVTNLESQTDALKEQRLRRVFVDYHVISYSCNY